MEKTTDAVRLAAVVLAARTPSATGRVEIRSGELGRWLGMSASYVASEVVPGLRRSGVVEITTVRGEFGEDRGLECKVLPMWAARGQVGHPLVLRKTELATLLRLLEAVMAPGWAHRDGTVTPAGLLGARRGRGAATDRLVLLLLVLEATETGRVRMCGGTVDSKRGRAAATVARLLGCTASRGERVLERLEDYEVVERVRLRTVSGMAQRTRLMVPAVAAAHGPARAAGPKEWHAASPAPAFSDPDVAAGPGGASEPTADAQVSAVQAADRAEMAEPDVTAALHTDHSPGGNEGGDSAGHCGFSGGGRGGEGRLPDRACAREDQAVDGEEVSGLTLVGGEGDPLRGEKPKEFTAIEVDERLVAVTAATGQQPVVASGKAQQQRGVPRPADPELRVVLTSVSGLWSRLSRWQQKRVERAARAELVRLASLLEQPEAAPQLLAERLSDRLTEQGGEVFVRDPFGWLLGKGLVRRPACSDVRCDDGTRLDTGGDCPTCGNMLGFRRAQRARIAAEVEAALLGADDAERRAVLEERLRHQATLEADDLLWRRRQAEAEQARREAARQEARARVERERLAAHAADEARQALPCVDCGVQRSAGLCEACGYRRQTRHLVEETALVVAAWAADIADPADVAAVAAHVRSELESAIAAARQQFLEWMDPAEMRDDPQQLESCLAFNARQAVQQAAADYHSTVLALLGRSREAEMGAKKAYATEIGRRRHRWHPDGPSARAAASKAADAARERSAQYLLATGLEQLRSQQGGRIGAATLRHGQ
ncbi:hypothetical protein [Streptomyces sp. 8N706]|uniref:hypothetical protein n=1 Tax=Streptomyces sp. 8N706 TaxID=3457416 RepID=UPI003FD52B66